MRIRLRTLLTVLAIFGFLPAGLSPFASAADKGLNGRWKVVSTMQGGNPIVDAVGQFAIFVDDRYVQEDKHGRVTSTGTIKIDHSREPPTIDALPDNSKGSNLGVYKLRGDSLEICWGYAKRPESLDSSTDKTFVHFLLARVPDE